MTTLEIILIITIWIGYGAFNNYQSQDYYDISDIALDILFAPIILITRIFKGIFSEKNSI